jgi:hypothetical protein
MKVYKPGVSSVSDSADQPKEVTKLREVETAPEPAKRAGVIADTEKQANWRETQEQHMLEQHESATDMFFKPGQLRTTTEKFELFDSVKAGELKARIESKQPQFQNLAELEEAGVHEVITLNPVQLNMNNWKN